MFNKRTKIKQLLEGDKANFETTVMGWVRTFRNNQFIALNDGSTNNNLQVVAALGLLDEATMKRITTGACIKATGEIIESQGKGQRVELKATSIEILGDSDAEKFPLQPKKHSLEFLREIAHLRMRTNTFGAIFRVRHSLAFAVHKFYNDRGFVYMHTPIITGSDAEKFPLQPKKHSLEFLREIAHLRMRTNTFGAIFRVRHSLAFAVHKFYNDRGFVYMHTPIITGSDAEGAGEMFKVTTLPLDGTAPKNDDGSINYKEDFFGKSTNLTVSGQLEGELAAMSFSDIYTFGPTFRAENSNTTRHLAEFWMIEPEVAFNDLEDNMNLAEDFIKYIIKYAMDNNADDLAFLAQRLEEEEKQKPQNERSEMGLLDKLKFVVDNDFERLTYTEAIEILRESNHNKKKKFQYLIEGWGTDLQSEHERYLVEKHFKKPVILTDYPKEIKSFYMRQNDDGKTVAAMDILAPGIGEIVGGSQREERLDKLMQRMEEMHIPVEEMNFYLDTRRFGSCPHAGFGLGFERLVLFVTGMTNIRDVIPFPRYPKSAAF